MHFFAKFSTFLKKGRTPLPRTIFAYAKDLGINIQEIGFICKLLNYNIDGRIFPEIEGLAKNAGVSAKTYQRAAKSLEEKGYLKKIQKRGDDGRMGANDYDLVPLWRKIHLIVTAQPVDQLSLFQDLTLDLESNGDITNKRSISARFGAYASSVLSMGYEYVPRQLDENQKELGLDDYEVVFIKFLILHMDGNGIANVSLNQMRKKIGISKEKTAAMVKSLSAKEILAVESQRRLKKKWSNLYDMNLLFKKIADLEEKKQKEALKEMNKTRSKGNIAKKTTNPGKEVAPNTKTEATKTNTEIGMRDKVRAIEGQISILRASCNSKYSEEAEAIRVLESQLSELVGKSPSGGMLKDLLQKRLNRITKKSGQEGPENKAKEICEKLRGNWKRNRNLYLKAVKTFPNTVDQHVAASLELGREKEKYFATIMGNLFKEKSITT